MTPLYHGKRSHSVLSRAIAIALFAGAMAASQLFGASQSIVAAVLRADADYYVFGENHIRVSQQLDLLALMDTANAKGVRTLALEAPRSLQRHLDEFAKHKIGDAALSVRFYQKAYQELPQSYRIKLDIIRRARDLGWNLVAVDGTEDTMWRLGTAEKNAKIDRRFRDPEGEALVRQKGLHPEVPTDSAQANIEAWRLMLDGRTQDMAKGMIEAKERFGGKVMLAAGANHVSPQAGILDRSLRPELRPFLTMHGITDLLPKGTSVSVIYLGGEVDGAEGGPSGLEDELDKAGRGDRARLLEIEIGGRPQVFAYVGRY